MNFHIHISIAKALKDIIEEELSVKINTIAFFFGSIKPDLLPNIITAPHEIKYSQKFIEDEIKCLLKENIISKKCSWAFSERIGIIMHYLSDFFCYAHSDSYKGNIWQHCYYEFKHSRYFLKSFKTIIRNIKKLDSFYINLNYIDKYLERQYKNYLGKSPSAARDLIYSLKICASISYSIIATLTSEFYQHRIQKEHLLLHSA